MTSSVQLCELAGLTYRQLDYWTRKGLLTPEGNLEGPGSRRSWPPAEVQVACDAAALLRVGFAPDAAVWAARKVVDGVIVLSGDVSLHLERKAS